MLLLLRPLCPLLCLVGRAAILGRALLWLWASHLCWSEKLGTRPLRFRDSSLTVAAPLPGKCEFWTWSRRGPRVVSARARRLTDRPSVKSSWKKVLLRCLGVGPPRVDERIWESPSRNVPLPPPPPAGGALHTSVAAAVPELSDYNFGSRSETLTCGGSSSFPRVPAW